MFKNIFKKTYKVSFNEFQVVISEVLKSRTDYGLNMYRQEKLLDEKDENIFSLTYCLYHIFIIEKQLCQKYESNFCYNLVKPFYDNLKEFLTNKEIIFDTRNELLEIFNKENFIDAYHNPIYNLSKTFMKKAFNIEYDIVTLQFIILDFMSAYKESYILTDYKIINDKAI